MIGRNLSLSVLGVGLTCALVVASCAQGGTATDGTGGLAAGTGGNGGRAAGLGGTAGGLGGTPGVGGGGGRAGVGGTVGGLGGTVGGVGGRIGGVGGTIGGVGGTVGGVGGTIGGTGGNTACPVSPNTISDFEEGFGVMKKQGGRTGFWYTYADTCPTPPANSYTCPSTAASSLTPATPPATAADTIAVGASGVTDVCNKFAFHSTSTNHGAFVGFGAAFSPAAPPSTSTVKAAYDLSAFDGISFKMKSGSGTQPAVYFEMLTKENQPDTSGGSISSTVSTAAHQVTDLFNTRGVVLNRTPASWQPAISTSYQTYYIPFGMLMPRWVPAQGGSKACPLNPIATDPVCQAPKWVPTSALGFQLSVLPDFSGTTGSYDLWVDDVALYTRPTTGTAVDLPAPPSGGGSHPFPRNAALAHCTKPTGPSVDGKFLVSAYNQWKATFVVAASGGMRVQRPEVNNDSVSEGIAYGMLISVYMNDKALFDGLWGYWKANPATSDGPLMTWDIPGGQGSATDADEDAAFAMLMASRQWTGGSPAGDSNTYTTNATNLMHAVLAHDMSTTSPFILGGSNYKNPQVGTTNPSYFAPAWYTVFAAADPTNTTAWNTLATNAYTMLAAINGTSPTYGLFAAWCGSGCTVAVMNSGSQNAATDVLYQYDSHRIPLRIGLDYCFNGGSAAATYLSHNSAFFAMKSAKGIGRILDIYNPNGTDPSIVTSAPNSASIIGTAAVGAMSSTTNATFLNDAYQAVFDMVTRGSLAPVDSNGKTPYSYYNATVGMLTLLAMTGNMTVF